MPSRFLPAPGLAASLVLAGIFAAAPAFSAAPAGVTLSNPWVRFILPGRPAAGYFTLKNASGQPASLTGASSPDCGQTMLHHSVQENGQDKMVMVKTIDVPAHGSLAFAPGGYHVMCMQPGTSVKIGGSMPFTLTFSDGSTITAPFPVKGPTGK